MKLKSINICYTDEPNIGDAINPIIVKKIMKYNPICTDQFNCQISGIGSGLRRFFVNPYDMNNIDTIQYFENKHKVYNKEIILWSSGFITTPTCKEIPISEKIKVASVRGELSKKYIETIINKRLDCSVGDAGLLVSKLIKKPLCPKYKLGIIPQRREKNEMIYQEIAMEISDSIIIDVEPLDPMTFIKQIIDCECIISSSLHGLVLADSFCIPSRHVKYTNKLVGDGIKFRDYYSGFEMDDVPQDLNIDKNIDIDDIKESYHISGEMIEKKQNEIIEAFHRFL